MPASPNPRFLELLGAGNVRDLGGLPAGVGRRTRAGRILRSDFLRILAPADEAELVHRFGVHRVVDLRTEGEVERHPGPWEERGVEVVRARMPLDPAFVATDNEDMARLYLQFLEAPALVRALEAAIDPGAQPLLIHCSAGKDRTGVLVCLLLDLIGVDREAIVADYTLTHARMPAVIRRLEAESVRAPTPHLPAVMFGAEEATVGTFLAGLDERYGGARGWARDQGVQASRIAAFSAAMTEPV